MNAYFLAFPYLNKHSFYSYIQNYFLHISLIYNTLLSLITYNINTNMFFSIFLLTPKKVIPGVINWIVTGQNFSTIFHD